MSKSGLSDDVYIQSLLLCDTINMPEHGGMYKSLSLSSWDLGKDKAVDMTDGMIVALAISGIIFEL